MSGTKTDKIGIGILDNIMLKAVLGTLLETHLTGKAVMARIAFYAGVGASIECATVSVSAMLPVVTKLITSKTLKRLIN